MYKDTSDKCYPDNKGRLQKKRLVKSIKIFLKNRKEKSNNIG